MSHSTQLAITFSNLKLETLEQGVKYVLVFLLLILSKEKPAGIYSSNLFKNENWDLALTKVNQEWTSMRKNFFRILINKTNVFNKKMIVSNE